MEPEPGDLTYNSAVAKAFVGIVKVDISSVEIIKFGPNKNRVRGVDPERVTRLIRIFSDLDPSDPLESTRCRPINHIKASVTTRELHQLLLGSHLTREALLRSLTTGDYPKLQLPRKLCCVHGQHRLAAAEKILRQDDCWWPVQLYCFDLGNPFRKIFIQRESEQYQHEAKYSDGEIYVNIRYYQKERLKDLERDWWIRLTDCKRYALGRLLRHTRLRDAIDKVVDSFPAQSLDIRLGSWKRILDGQCDEQIICYFEHIYAIFSQIVQNMAIVQEALDIYTLRTLQGRAPSVSKADRDIITRLMDNKSLFSGLTDPGLREATKRTILSLGVIIPTIKSFHENYKQFEIGAKILKSLLLDEKDLPKNYKSINGEDPPTLYKAMRSKWSSTGKFPVEYREFEFQSIILPDPIIEAHLSFVQLFISAMRNFPFLSKFIPRIDPHRNRDQKGMDGKLDPVYQCQFLERGEKQGYRTREILHRSEKASDLRVNLDESPEQGEKQGSRADLGPKCLPLDVQGESLERRWGRPFTSAFQHFRTRLFLPNLTEAQREVSLKPSVMFIQQDFIKAFFGPIPEMPGMEANLQPPSLSVQLVFPGPKPSACETPSSRHDSCEVVSTSSDVSAHHLNYQSSSAQIIESNDLRENTPIGPLAAATVGATIGLTGHSINQPPDIEFRNIIRETAASPESCSSSESSRSTEVSVVSSWAAEKTPSLEMKELSESFMRTGLPPNLVHGVVTEQCIETHHPATEFLAYSCEEVSYREDGDEHLESIRSFLSPITSPHMEDTPEILSPEMISETDPTERCRSFATNTPTLEESCSSPRPSISSDSERSDRSRLLHSDILRESFCPPESVRASTNSTESYRSFLQLGKALSRATSPDGCSTMCDETRESCRSFVEPSNWLPNASSNHHSYVSENRESQRSFIDVTATPLAYNFTEYNGMSRVPKSTNDMEQYLKNRMGWTMMITKGHIAKTLRFNSIIQRMKNKVAGENFVLVKPSCEEQFLRIHTNTKRPVVDDSEDINKRMKIKR